MSIWWTPGPSILGQIIIYVCVCIYIYIIYDIYNMMWCHIDDRYHISPCNMYVIYIINIPYTHTQCWISLFVPVDSLSALSPALGLGQSGREPSVWTVSVGSLAFCLWLCLANGRQWAMAVDRRWEVRVFIPSLPMCRGLSVSFYHRPQLLSSGSFLQLPWLGTENHSFPLPLQTQAWLRLPGCC